MITRCLVFMGFARKDLKVFFKPPEDWRRCVLRPLCPASTFRFRFRLFRRDAGSRLWRRLPSGSSAAGSFRPPTAGSRPSRPPRSCASRPGIIKKLRYGTLLLSLEAAEDAGGVRQHGSLNTWASSGCSTAVEHMPAEQNYWGRGFNSH